MTVKRTVSTSYRFSRQVDPTRKDSPWMSAEVGYAAEGDIEDHEAMAKALFIDAKLQVFSQLGIEYDENLQPVLGVAEIPATAKRTSPQAKSSDRPDPDKIVLGGKEYADYRGLKKDGKVAAKYPDFKLGTRGFWLTDTEGQPTDFAKQFESELV
jgi:hypothetical protein